MKAVIPCFIYDLFTVKNWFQLFGDISGQLGDTLTDTTSMGTPVMSSGRRVESFNI